MNENVIKEARQMFGLTFRNLRLEKGLTQTEVGDFCKVSYQTINKVEQGKFPYSVDLLMKLSIVLEFTINFEMKEKGNPDRFILQESKQAGYLTATDTTNQIVCSFQIGKFNVTQKFTSLNDTQFDVGKLSTIMKEFGDWLQANHADKL
jgi:transcriptional regulator with XRE-family HTH domain